MNIKNKIPFFVSVLKGKLCKKNVFIIGKESKKIISLFNEKDDKHLCNIEEEYLLNSFETLCSNIVSLLVEEKRLCVSADPNFFSILQIKRIKDLFDVCVEEDKEGWNVEIRRVCRKLEKERISLNNGKVSLLKERETLPPVSVSEEEPIKREKISYFMDKEDDIDEDEEF